MAVWMLRSWGPSVLVGSHAAQVLGSGAHGVWMCGTQLRSWGGTQLWGWARGARALWMGGTRLRSWGPHSWGPTVL